MNGDVFFTADTHFGHKNIFKHQPKRINEVMEYSKSVGVSEKDFLDMILNDDPKAIRLHDEWLINMWNKTVDKSDNIFIIGDFSFKKPADTIKLIHRLNGKKYLVYGNHDCNINQKAKAHFILANDVIQHCFKKSAYTFLDESIRIYMCHYRSLIWCEKHYGSIHLCGHNHGRLDDYNEKSSDLCVDVGLDGKLSNYHILKLEEVYNYFKNKSGGKLFQDYVNDKVDAGEMII